ncbi:TenA family transcriptional regulator [Streptomyces morookaense]|uniref:TenA family transcriptional regulator n=1 Tax=Streptomyces morookaense TaxID=1970 RepID=A0A7Y7B244_STRMO|nr:TenA family transcriptional regulator [Streptomyces morookaense]NVK77532.1 TenA family transcriptional regulator [Streptomyces morookaense]
MLHQELNELAEPVWKEAVDHPFWAGIRDGSLPPRSLTVLVEQSAGHLLPAYARALARTAAATRWEHHVSLLARAAVDTVQAGARLLGAHNGMCAEIGAPPADPTAAVAAATHAHTAFLHAATDSSVAAGMGALLPLAWFQQRITDDLRARRQAGSRYEAWTEMYHPGSAYARTVSELVAAYDELGELMSGPGRTELVTYFTMGLRYTHAVTEAAWTHADWPTRTSGTV